MAYEVTATRKRPQVFDEIVGQEFVVSTLKRSVESGRIAHAYLFAGPRGVGKTSAARILAKALNCEHGPTDTPCGKCSACREIQQGNSFDVIEIDGASNTSVNDVREIKDEVLFAPNSSRYKVYIIDEVHMLSNSAFNALLKTIEEPPPYIVFIFATTEIHKVPATIRSRCQQFNFRLIPLDGIRKQLSEASTEMETEAEEEALFWIAKEATGSLRDAYTLLDQVLAFSDGKITHEKIRKKLGLVGIDHLNALVTLMVHGKADKVLETTDDILRQGVSVEQLILDLAEYFRSVLFLTIGIRKAGLLGFTPDRFSKDVLSSLTVTQAERSVELFLNLHRDIRYSLNPRYELELVLSKLSYIQDYLSSGEILKRIEELRGELIQETVADNAGDTLKDPGRKDKVNSENTFQEKQSTEFSGTSTVGTGTTGTGTTGTDSAVADLEEQKNQVIASLRNKKLILSTALEKATKWELLSDRLEITFNSAFLVSSVEADLTSVAEAFEKVTGTRTRIILKVEGRSKDQESNSSNRQVEMVKRVFRGEIVQGDNR